MFISFMFVAQPHPGEVWPFPNPAVCKLPVNHTKRSKMWNRSFCPGWASWIFTINQPSRVHRVKLLNQISRRWICDLAFTARTRFQGWKQRLSSNVPRKNGSDAVKSSAAAPKAQRLRKMYVFTYPVSHLP